MSIEIVKGFPVDADGRVRGEFTHNPSSLRLSMRDAFKAKVDELESLVQRLQVIGPDRVVEPSSNPCKLAEARCETCAFKEEKLSAALNGQILCGRTRTVETLPHGCRAHQPKEQA